MCYCEAFLYDLTDDLCFFTVTHLAIEFEVPQTMFIISD